MAHLRINVGPNTIGFAATGGTLRFGDYVVIKGDFTVQKVDQGLPTERTLYGARNVQVFLGRGPPELEDGSVNPDAVGVLVQNTELGVVKFADGTFALYATGEASIIGLGNGIHVEGSLEVKINTTGRTVNETISIPESGTINVVFTSPQRVEVFEGGVTLGVGKVGNDYVFGISGTVRFTRNPIGQVQVDVPDATVYINIPDGSGGLQSAFSISGAAKFAFGGAQGFRLQDLRVNGFSVFGVSATVPQPAPTLRPPKADLNLPYNGGVFDVQELNDRGYIEVVFNDVNGVGLNENSITDDSQEFILTIDGNTPDTYGVTINGRAEKVGESNVYRYNFTGTFPEGDVQLKFLPQAWSDTSGANNVTETEHFTIAAKNQGELPAPAPTAMLGNPANGASVNLKTLITRAYIDVTFLVPEGLQLDAGSIDGDEFTLSGTGVADAWIPDFNLNEKFDVSSVSGTTYRYKIVDSNAGNDIDIFKNGEVEVTFAANKWRLTDTTANAAGKAHFTVQSDTQDAAASSDDFTLGPLVLVGPSIGLADTSFDAGKLVITVAIGMDEARLSFGSQQGDSGITAELTGILGTFDIEVDVLALIGGDWSSAFSVPGKFGLKIDGLDVNIPNIVRITATKIKINYDPNYDPADHGGHAQELLSLESATVNFERFNISGSLAPYNGKDGLVVRGDGFSIGEASLSYNGIINLGDIIEFDGITIGVQGLDVVFGQSLDFDGNIFIASGGASFFPGRPVSATITDSNSDGKALSVTLDFENGKVKDLIFDVDTFRIELGGYVTLTGRNIKLNTGAAANEEIIRFGSIGAEVRIGSMLITGEGRNFAFLGDGTFKTLPGFGVFLGIGSATGSGFGWPDWMPIKITQIGIEWPDIQADPADFTITLSATVSSIKGCKGLEFSGTIEGLKIDIGLLLAGKFPIVDIASIGVGVKGKMFGGELDAQLIGGIIKVDALGNKIDPTDSTTPVEDRIFFIGVQGGFEIAGMGLTIRFALSELGPLGVFINASIPGGVVIVPQIGLALNDFAAGVEFFQSLPCIEDPFELRRPEFGLPTEVTPETWLAQVKDQVVTQYNMVKANPGTNGFLAAFTSPMTITGSCKIFTLYTSMQVFNGQVMVKISTDGKFLVTGKLNFADDNISISAKLYANLSKIAAGEATVLFLADIPDQVQLLTIYGKLQMGFRDVHGDPIPVEVIDASPATPIGDLAGPRNGDVIGIGSINNRGYIDVRFDVPSGYHLDIASVTDIGAEFEKFSAGSTVVFPDNAQAPVLIDEVTNTFRYWVTGQFTAGSTVTAAAIDNSWFIIEDGSGEETLNGGSVSVVNFSEVNTSYIDITYHPSTNAELDISKILDVGDEFELGGPGATGVSVSTETPTRIPGTNTFRYYLNGSFSPDLVEVNFLAGAWEDTAMSNLAETESFTVVAPTVDVVGPFNGPSIDVTVLNHQEHSGQKYIDVVFRPTPGSVLDYSSIFDSNSEFDLTVGGSPVTVASPMPLKVGFDENGLLVTTVIEKIIDPDTGSLETDEVYYVRLADEGITRFRYTLDEYESG